MAKSIDYYNTGFDNWRQIWGAISWSAQTFTASLRYRISSVKLRLCRSVGSFPGIVTVELQGTSGGEPDNSALATGTIDGDTFTADIDGLWYEIIFDFPYTLVSGTVYAIVVKAVNGDVINRVNWKTDTVASYANGAAWSTVTGTGGWVERSGEDFMFETYKLALNKSLLWPHGTGWRF